MIRSVYCLWLTIFAVLMSYGFTAVAQDSELPATAQQVDSQKDANTGDVGFPSEFFQRYQPNNALDMVRRVPGFSIDDGGSKRGFGGAAGNILINGRRPSTKDDAPSAILARVPAGNVERIELIRGQLRGVDMRGQSVVANVILREDAPATTRWGASIGENFDHGFSLRANVSLSSRWQDIEYSVGLDGSLPSNGDPGIQEIYGGNGNLIEKRFKDTGSGHSGFEGHDANGFINASTWFGETFLQLNSKVGMGIRDINTVITSEPQPPLSGSSQQTVFDEQRRNFQFEIGLDAERLLHEDLLGKAIVLFNNLHQYPDDVRRRFNSTGDLIEFRLVDTQTDSSESIGRLEFNWAGWADHAVQLNLEGAFNILDKELVETIERPGDVQITENVPGGNIRVEELRGDFLFKDTWTLGELVFDYGLGLEVSRIVSEGDTDQSRTFTFLKPESLLTYSPDRQQQTRLRFAREVAQLNLNDFASAAVLQDDNLALGNPDLEPESTWLVEVSHERRFGEMGVITLTAFHHWITEVEDFIPVEIPGRPDEFFEARGNLGDGKRWGLRLGSTVPLDWLGLRSARLDLQLGWQDSKVTDPVTGEDRILSSNVGRSNPHPPISFTNETKYTFIIDYRQDFESSRVSWGGNLANQGRRPQFKTDTLDIRNAGYRLNAFIETTRWWDLNLRLDLDNALGFAKTRDRTVFVGQRDRSPVSFRERERLTIGTELVLSVNGSF